MSVRNEFMSYMERCFTQFHLNVVSRIKGVYPSGLPFCGLRSWLLDEHIESEGEEYAQSMYYMSMGTTFHMWIQSVLCHGGQILGNYVCTNPDCKKEYSSYIPTAKQGAFCKKCKSLLRYKEIYIRYGEKGKAHHRGMLDGVFKSNDKNHKGEYFVIEYKSTSVRQIERHRREGGVFPYYQNDMQTRRNIILLENRFKVPVAGGILIYLARDNPFRYYVVITFLVSDEEKAEIRKQAAKDNEAYHRLLRLEDSPSLKNLQQLAKLRGCPTREYYDTKMRPSWHECPFGEARVCWKKKRLAAALEKEYSEKYDDAPET